MNAEQKDFLKYGEALGIEEAYKKASEATEELSSWQYERR